MIKNKVKYMKLVKSCVLIITKLKLNAYSDFKITFDKERLPLLLIQLAEFWTLLLAKTPTCKTGF
jgi:hypothetical protein